MKKTLLAAAAVLSLAACGPESGGPEAWMGLWNGPEGTSLELTPQGEGVRVTITDLDGPTTYEGMVDAGNILFTRDGVQETIRAGTGTETGMKWLLEKENCLVIKEGEGFCRD